MSDRHVTIGDWGVHERDYGIDGGAPTIWGEHADPDFAVATLVCIAFSRGERQVALARFDEAGDEIGDPLVIELPRWEPGLVRGAVLGVCAMAGLASPPSGACVEQLFAWGVL